MSEKKVISPSKDSICVVIPVYNSEKTIGELVGKLEQTLSLFREYRIIAVDDHSTDGTKNTLCELSKKNNRIIGIRFAKNYGQQRAVLEGLRRTKCDYTVIIDDDLEQNPSDITALYKAIKQGYDVVYGIDKNMCSKANHRRIGSKVRDMLFDRLTNKPKEIKVCSFRIMDKKTVEKVVKTDFRKPYISMEIFKHTNNIGNIEVEYKSNSDSGYSLFKLTTLIFNIFLYYAPIKLFKLFRKKGNECKEVSLCD